MGCPNLLLYQSTISPIGVDERYGSVTTRYRITAGELSAPVADLRAADFGQEQEGGNTLPPTYIEKNLRAVTIVDADANAVTQVYRNDNVEPSRTTFAIHYRLPEGFKLVGIDQRFVANKFKISENGIDLIGREFPETYAAEPFIFRMYGKNDAGDFVETQMSVATDKKSIVCKEKTYEAKSNYVTNVLAKKTYTGFVRTFGADKFVNAVRVPTNTQIYVNPAVLQKVNMDRYLNRYFPGGIKYTADCRAEEAAYDTAKFAEMIEAVVQDKTNPVYQIYFIGYGYTKTKVLREIADAAFSKRRKAHRAERSKNRNKQSKRD